MIAQITAKITNSEKAIYFLSLMPCLINTLKSHMFFTCKNFMFSDFTLKKNILLQEMGGGGGIPLAPTFPTALYYGEGLMTQQGIYYFSMNYVETGEHIFSLKQA